MPRYTALGLCFVGFAFEQWGQIQASQHGNNKPLEFIRKNLVLSLSNIRDGRWWTLVTYSFMHGNILHFSFNAMALLSFGLPITSVFGRSAFVIGWLGAALSGAAASLWWEINKGDGRTLTNHVGASGCVFAFMTILTFLKPDHKVFFFNIIPMPMWFATVGTVGLSVASLANSWFPSIGHTGHLGGIGFGALYYFTRLRPRLVLRNALRRG